MKPRPYQAEAVAALNQALRERDDNPCIVLPTGAGKSLVIAWTIQQWRTYVPHFRIIVLAHRSELIEQNAAELATVAPDAEYGIYAAGLDRRDTDQGVIYATIDSVYNKAIYFSAFDAIIVDEAHRIPAKGEGKYRTFIADAKRANPALRVVGFTATPYRLGCGPICHPQHILNHIAYEAPITQLIADGYLSPLRAKISSNQPDLSKVRKSSTGDYVVAALADAVDAVVSKAVSEIVGIINAEKRQCVVVFCVNREHCQHVSQAFAAHGIAAPMVDGTTDKATRRQTVEDFKAGKYRVLCNINVYTEGFNVKQVDCVVLLRPTLSAGLYSQMVGRGLRIHPSKTDCLVLDYGDNINRHGPLDQLDGGEVRLVTCGSCREAFSRAVGACPACGWDIPKVQMVRMEAEEKERQLHAERAAQMAILSNQEDLLEVDAVMLSLHKRDGKPDAIRVDYRCGMQMVSELLCLASTGKEGQDARAWWAARFGWESANNATTDDVLHDMFAPDTIKNRTMGLIVSRCGGTKLQIVRHHLKEWNQ
jgi:DNA repair protein RadD